jgi:hypothetical protein
MSAIMRTIDSAGAAGQDVTTDQYPATAGSNNLSSGIPPWAHADGQLILTHASCVASHTPGSSSYMQPAFRASRGASSLRVNASLLRRCFAKPVKAEAEPAAAAICAVRKAANTCKTV